MSEITRWLSRDNLSSQLFPYMTHVNTDSFIYYIEAKQHDLRQQFFCIFMNQIILECSHKCATINVEVMALIS